MSIQPYRYGLALATNSYIDLSSGINLIKAKRVFSIYRWESTLEFEKIIGKIKHNECGVPVRIRETIKIKDTGAWLPSLRFTNGKWIRITENQRQNMMLKLKSTDVMKPMHMFFKDDIEFSKWLTKDIYNKLIIELI